MSNQTEILLESGTNELEILEFTIAGQLFGINVAKVREIMKRALYVRMAVLHGRYLGLEEACDMERHIYIITEFNNLHCAFHVHTVEGIERISWKQIKKPDDIIYGGGEGVATGIAECRNHLITILDFEKIVAEISPKTGIQYDDLKKLGDRADRTAPILVAEDSTLLSKMIVESLHRAGLFNLLQKVPCLLSIVCFDGVHIAGAVHEHVACVITDIEMPQMDGHRLTHLIRKDDILKSLPIILFSSLINKEMRIKGEELGANAQISKPEIATLVTVIDKLLNKT